MYATIRRYRAIGSVAEAVTRVQRDLVPQMRRIPGLISYTVLEVGETITAVSVFNNRSDAEESNRVAALWVDHNLKDLLELPAQVATGEVLIYEAPPSLTP